MQENTKSLVDVCKIAICTNKAIWPTASQPQEAQIGIHMAAFQINLISTTPAPTSYIYLHKASWWSARDFVTFYIVSVKA